MTMASVVMVVMVMVVISAATESVLHPQPLPLPLLVAQGRIGPHYGISKTLNSGSIDHSVHKQDLGVLEELDKESFQGVQGSLRFLTANGKPSTDPQLHVSSEATTLTHFKPSGHFEESEALKQRLQNPSKQKGVYGVTIPHRKDSKNTLKRQKRYTLKYKLRSIAVPLSVFNFLGFLPVRVPGLPYHHDLPSPDYTHYNTKYDVFVPRYRRRKTFRRF